MTISLTKGQNISLTKDENASQILKNLTLGLGWDIRTTDGAEFDLDAVAFLVNESGKAYAEPEKSVVYFKLTEQTGIKHSGDNRTGAGDGDDETIQVQLEQLPAELKEVVLSAVIFGGKENGQTFGQVNNAYIRLFNPVDGKELCRFDLTEDYSANSVIDVAKLYRHNGEWKFKALGEGRSETIEETFKRYGIL